MLVVVGLRAGAVAVPPGTATALGAFGCVGAPVVFGVADADGADAKDAPAFGCVGVPVVFGVADADGADAKDAPAFGTAEAETEVVAGGVRACGRPAEAVPQPASPSAAHARQRASWVDRRRPLRRGPAGSAAVVPRRRISIRGFTSVRFIAKRDAVRKEEPLMSAVEPQPFGPRSPVPDLASSRSPRVLPVAATGHHLGVLAAQRTTPWTGQIWQTVLSRNHTHQYDDHRP
ncbi:hypothetical protein LN042_21300 [Kitasatospora sp. RB6PN24]|uniref:hypothetical protein n=1 Tax=Kitasatospora humi TaxID=2893891 RepID=UPI001E5E6EFD|nr:hypothetical protein [Kitasatospora humi]MCC9309580.1 hypothetical protein [Kitasatospora humi]